MTSTGSVTATVNLGDAAVSVVVTGWTSTLTITGSVVASSPTFNPGNVGTNGHGFTLPYGTESLYLGLHGTSTNPSSDIDMYLYYDGPTGSRLVASSDSADQNESLAVGRLPAGHYTAWVHGFNALPVTGSPYTLTISGNLRPGTGASTVLDTFTRTVTGGWGTADSGQAWTTTNGSASDYSTNGTQGLQTATSVNVLRHTTISGLTSPLDVYATVEVSALATGATITAWLFIGSDTSNYYVARLDFDTSGNVSLLLLKRVATVLTTLAGPTVIGTYVGGTKYRVRLQHDVLDGIGVTRAKAWAVASATEPNWTMTFNDTSLATFTMVGTASRAETGNTNVNPVVRWDDVSLDQTEDAFQVPVQVTRVATDVYGNQVETTVLGSPATPSNGKLVMWDSVAPLGTSVFYRAYDTLLPDGMTVNVPLASGNVSITGQGDGWLKDPVIPTNDIHLVPGCTGATCQIDCTGNGGITFQSVGEASFRTTDGDYDIVNAARDQVIAQVRAARESTLVLLAHHLPDGLKIETILRSGRVLCLQLDPAYGWGYDTWYSDYVNVGDARETRLSGTTMTYVERVWSLSFKLTNAPVVTTGLVAGNGIGVAGTTFSAGTASGRTYAQRTATGNTYADSTLGRGL